MSLEIAAAHLKKWNRDQDIKIMSGSTATVPLAAQALGVIPARIAKSLCLKREESAMLIVVAGDGKIDNQKFKTAFGFKARMLKPEETLSFTGHEIGGVCPFGIAAPIPVYLDTSLKRFKTVFPACGTDNSMIEVTIPELEEYSGYAGWVDICKLDISKTN